MQLLIKNAHLYTGHGNDTERKDLLIQGGTVAAIEVSIAPPPGTPVLQADGCLIVPGLTDLHVHLREPGYGYKETIASGTKAAAAGGFTTVCAMPNLNPVPDSPETLAAQQHLINESACIEVLPYGSITCKQQGEKLSDMDGLAPDVIGYSDDGVGVQSGDVMRRAMEQAARNRRPIAAHCECDELIAGNAVCVQQDSDFAAKNGFVGVSNESEWAEVERNIKLAQQTGCHLHICHVSTAETVELVRQAKLKGAAVTCEVTPHNLLLSADDVTSDSGRFKMNPPLRTKQDQMALFEALIDGTIDAIATDHAPHTDDEKAGGFRRAANGVVGLETAFVVLYTHLVRTNKLSLAYLLQLMNNKPRRLMGLPANTIRPGQKATLAILDITTERAVEPKTFLSKGRATPFEGWVLTGWPIITVADGELAYRHPDLEVIT